MKEDVFAKYIGRLQKEGWLKAALCGLVAGFSAMLITAAICWYVGFKGFWVSLIVLAVISAAVTPAFYFLAFRPTKEKLARRLDALGLDERIITMNEFEASTSFIAMKQREDAVKALGGVDAKKLSIALSIPLLIAISAVGVLGIGMTTYSAVAEVSGKELVEKWNDTEPEQFKVTYSVEGSGKVVGEKEQTVEEGKNGSGVIAVADKGYVFVGWSDGEDQPYRVASDVKADMVYTARFEEIGADGLEQDMEPDPEPSDDGDPSDNDSDEKDDRPKDMSDSDNSNNKPNDGSGDDLGGGKSDPKDQVYDGNTFYGDETYDSAVGDAIEGSSSNDGISDGDRGVIGDYFDTIKK